RADEAAAIAPVLSYVLGVEDAKPRDVEPEQLQRQIALAARALIERRLQHEPLMIVVDDLHWADSASVDLLRSIVDHLADRPLMVLLSHRPEARPPLVTRAAHEAVDVPATLHGLLLARVDRLPGEMRRLLQEAAVLGAEFDEALLRDIATDAGAIHAALDRLTDTDLIQTAGSARDGTRYR